MPAICERLEARQLLSASTITPGHPVTLVDADGSGVTFKLTGRNSMARVTPDADGGFDIAINASGAKASLAVTVLGGDGSVILDDVSAIGMPVTIKAPAAIATGDWNLASAVSLSIHGAQGATFVSGSLGRVTAIDSFENVRIDAPHIAALWIGGDLTDAWLGLYPTTDAQPSGLRSLRVGGTMARTTIDALADIGSISTAAMLDSSVNAGVRWDLRDDSTAIQPLPAQRHNSDFFDFTGAYRIASVSVTGRTVAPVAFSDSRIGAHDIGRVSLSKVNGSRDAGESGVSGYKVGSITRRFEAQYSAKTRQQSPDSRFVARQIFEPLVFNPDTGTYGRAADSATSMTFGGFPSSTESTPPKRSTPFPESGEKLIANVTNAAATGIYFLQDGTYAIRDAVGTTMHGVDQLGTAIDIILQPDGKTIKQVAGNTFRVTSIGPKVELIPDAIDITYTKKVPVLPYVTYRATQFDKTRWTPRYGGYSDDAGNHISGSFADSIHQAIGRSPFNRSSNWITVPDGFEIQFVGGWREETVGFNVPNLAILKTELDQLGRGTQAFDTLTMMYFDNMAIGQRFDAGAHDPITITPSFGFQVNGIDHPEFARALFGDAPIAGGKDRLHTRLHVNGDKLFVYGLPRGGTAVYTLNGQTLLNATGDLLTLPDSAALKTHLRGMGAKI